jgi:hypothetical protein
MGPWASWSLVAADLTTASGTSSPGAPLPALPDPTFTTFSLGEPKNAGGKAVLNLALVPPRINLTTYRSYLSSAVAADPPSRLDTTPIDRHALDFGYLPYQIDALKVRAVCKKTAYSWLEGEGEVYDPPTNIKVTDYTNGSVRVLMAPQLFVPPFPNETTSPYAPIIPADYIPQHLVFYDDYIVIAKNDPDTPHFWIYVYSSTPGEMKELPYWPGWPENILANIVLLKTYTNKPGDLGVGNEKVIQVKIPELPTNSYLIGAMRDEVACM